MKHISNFLKNLKLVFLFDQKGIPFSGFPQYEKITSAFQEITFLQAKEA
jgi:hypothetical protein